MSRKRTPVRSTLGLDDLRTMRTEPVKLMNVSVPADTARGIDRVAAEMGVTKTDAVAALLNEGLAAFGELSAKWKPSLRRRRR
jgi:hypothetical protein